MAKQRSPGAFACAVVLTLALAVSSQGRAHARDRDDGDRQQQKLLECNDTLKDDFQPDSLTTVLLVKAFKKDDHLTLGTPTPTTPQAANDVCVVKLLVGPGNPGPVGAPSTSRGIGIEIWLPARENWNHRIHVTGGGGWAGGNQTNLTVLLRRPAPLSLPPWKVPSRRTLTPGIAGPAADRSR